MKIRVPIYEASLTPYMVLMGTYNGYIESMVHENDVHKNDKNKEIPKDIYNKYILINIINTTDQYKCPGCKWPLVDIDVSKRRCMFCHQYLAFIGESIKDIIEIRKAMMIYTHDLIPEGAYPSKKPLAFKSGMFYYKSNLTIQDHLTMDSAWNSPN